MPANKKHLTKSPSLRLFKILVGVIGGYAVTFTSHLMLSRIFLKQNVIVTSFITAYVLWAILLMLAFTSQSIRKVFAAYSILTLIFCGIYYML